MKYTVHQRHSCRICNSAQLINFLSLPDMPFTDDFVSKDEIGTEFLYPITIYICNECKTVQTQHDVRVDEYYEDYQYSVGGSQFASDFMRGIAVKIRENYFPDKYYTPKVLEVGSGDGEQLLAFKNTGCDVLGYEPSSFLVDIAAKKGVESVQGLFTKESTGALPNAFKKVDVIFLSYTFDHIPDPISFLQAAKEILNPDTGILIIENHDLGKIFERQEYCLFEHEHSIYLTKSTAQSLAEREGFSIVEFDVLPENQRRANSLVFVMTPHGSKHSSKKLVPINMPEYGDINFYKDQADKIHKGIGNLEKYIERKTQSGEKIAGYGAGGRGIMTLAAINNASHMNYLVDKKPKHEGVFSPKTHLPVYSIDHLEKERVDEVIVFSFGYMKEIKIDLEKMGYQSSKIHSMVDVLKGNI